MTSDSEEVYCDRCGAIADEGDKECWSCNHTVLMVREVTEEGSSTDGSANAKVSRKLAQEAQSEAPSVDSQIDEVFDWLLALYIDTDDAYMVEEMEEDRPIFRAKINRLIVEAYNKGYSDGRLVKPKYKVGDISGNYRITERFRRVGKNTKYKVVCILCGAPMFRYSNKFNLKHKECGAIKND